MALFNFSKKPNQTGVLNKDLESFLADYSIEVMPRTAQKVEDFRAILPQAVSYTHLTLPTILLV